MATQHEELAALSDYKYGFKDEVQYTFRSRKGLNAEVIRELSHMKGEPQWMLDFRLKALEIFTKKPMPTWGGRINLDFDEITYYTRPSDKTESNWDDVPADIKNTFDKLGIPEAERKFLAGVGAQYESEMVYHSV
ncbi:MAG: FeS assembly protein SufB, partial [Anaerolineales bacterium]|nr:FeS assembly protein SufB [Anaerolineales bacterium]